MKTFKIGDHEWCTATARWFVAGFACIRGSIDHTYFVVSAWETRVLFSLASEHPRLEVLRNVSEPSPLTAADEEKAGRPDSWPGVDTSPQRIPQPFQAELFLGLPELSPFDSGLADSIARAARNARWHMRQEKLLSDAEMDIIGEPDGDRDFDD